MAKVVPSVIQKKAECFFCKITYGLERHHIFNGAYRNKADKRGYTVYLCHRYHNEPPLGVHHNIERRNQLRKLAQEHYEKHIGTREEFRDEFGKSFLD